MTKPLSRPPPHAPRTVASRDGTRIAFWVSGDGPPCVLVHGACADHTTAWARVLPRLRDRFSLLALDRRGRGGSSDSPPYAIEREFEDVAAVVAAAGAPAAVVGHSFGAVCALGAALGPARIHRLVLYEPGAPGGAPPSSAAIEAMEASLARGDREHALRIFVAQVLDDVPGALRSRAGARVWRALLALVHTVPRELRAEAALRIDPARLERLRVPALLLVGSESPERFRAAARHLHALLPAAALETMAGQGHMAMQSDPNLFCSLVADFLER